MKKAIVFIEPHQIETFFFQGNSSKIDQIAALSINNQQQSNWLNDWENLLQNNKRTIFYFVLSSTLIDCKVEQLPKMSVIDQKRVLYRLRHAQKQDDTIYQLKGEHLFCYSIKKDELIEKIFTVASEVGIEVSKVINIFDLFTNTILKNSKHTDICYQAERLLHFYTYQDGLLKAKRDLYLQQEPEWLTQEIDNWQKSTGQTNKILTITSKAEIVILFNPAIKKINSYPLPDLRKMFFNRQAIKRGNRGIWLTLFISILSISSFGFLYQQEQELTKAIALQKQQFITAERQKAKQQQQNQVLRRLQQFDSIRPPEKCFNIIEKTIKKAWPLKIKHYTWQYEITEKTSQLKITLDLDTITDITPHHAMVWTQAVTSSLKKQGLPTAIEQSPLPLRVDQDWTSHQVKNHSAFKLTIDIEDITKCQ